MKECYQLDENYTVWELEELADVWYQRLKKINSVLKTETDPVRIKKAERIAEALTAILLQMTTAVTNLHQVRRKFNAGGVSSF